MAYRCSSCGQLHGELPDIGSDKPDYWWSVPPIERSFRIDMCEDACDVDGEFFFIRGVLEIPLKDADDRFGFGVWVSQKKENFQTYLENLESPSIGPFFGWLNTKISWFEEDTINLKTKAHFRGNGLRPVIVLEPSDHPLAAMQREGITLDEAWKIVHFYDLD